MGVQHSLLLLSQEKIIQLNEWGCRDGMHYEKNCGNKDITIITPYIIQAKGLRMIVRILDRGYLVSTIFLKEISYGN